MVDYIKKIILSKSEKYEIEYNGKVYKFSADEKLKEFLNYVEDSINKKIANNNRKVANIEASKDYTEKSLKRVGKLSNVAIAAAVIVNIGVVALALVLKEILLSLLILAPVIALATYSILYDKLDRLFKNPTILKCNDQNALLNEQLNLVQSLKKHLAGLENGIEIENDIFSEKYYANGVDLKDKIRLGLGFKPKTSEEYLIYKKNQTKKIAKIDSERKKVESKKESFPKDIKESSLRISNGVVKNIYANRLRELCKNNTTLDRELRLKASNKKKKKAMLNSKITDEAIKLMGIYPNKSIDELKKLVPTEKFESDAKYTKAYVEYADAILEQHNAENRLNSFRQNKCRKKAEIIHELITYRNLLKRHRNLYLKREDLAENMKSYSRIYR